MLMFAKTVVFVCGTVCIRASQRGVILMKKGVA